jgi:hypothetical protein
MILSKSLVALWNLGGIENNTDIILQKLCYGNGNSVANVTLSNHMKFVFPYNIGQFSKGINKIQGMNAQGQSVEISFDGYPTGFLKRKNGIPGVSGYKSTAGAQQCEYGKKCARVFIEKEGIALVSTCKQFEQDKSPIYILHINQEQGIYSVQLLES